MKVAIVMVLAALSITACQKPEQHVREARLFICEEDGEVSELHVGIESAVPTVKMGDYGAYVWTITYDDGRVAYYLPIPGETCQVYKVERPTLGKQNV